MEVRLNTNESPLPPPDQLARGLPLRAGGHRVQPLPRPRGAVELRRALADSHGVGPEQVFCANGSNEVLQSLLLAYGGPGRTVALFEPTYTLHGHIARITGTAVAAGPPDRRLPPRPRRGGAGGRGRPTGHHLPVLAQQPDRPGRPARRRSRRCWPWPRACWWWTRPTGSSPRPRPWTSSGGPGPERERVAVVRTFSKTWSMAGLRLGYLVADPDVVRGLRAGGPALPPRRGQAAGRPPGPPLRRRDGGPGGPAQRGAGSDRRRPGRPAGRDLALGRQLHPVPPAGGPGPHRCGPTSSTARCSCETVRSGRGSPGACG